MVDAVLLIAFGGPTRSDEIRPFLEIVTRGRRIPLARLDEVAHHYERMPGGRSPLNELTFAQARALEAALAARGRALPVFVGMRNWHPFLRDTIADMAGRGHRHVLAIILSPLRCEASWDRYQRDVAEACAGVPKPPAIRFAPAWSSHPSFIAAVTDRTRVALAGSAEAAPLVFTAHSIPTAMAAASPYVEELTAAAQAVAGQLGARAHEIAYQSRSGSPQEPWLEPDVNDTLRRLAAAGASEAVAVPIGFVCDHVEVLYDLDVEARATAAALGLTLRRASAVNDHPEFVAMLADLVTGGAA